MGKPKLYSKTDIQRVIPQQGSSTEPYRSEYRRDYARIIHSPSFRRLQGKTQLYQGSESDFFRNRLSHSIEVAQIAKSIVRKINHDHKAEMAEKIDEDLVEAAGLIHDLGHPPFGHNGEDALDICMREWGGFEGNAQTLRILGRLEKKVPLPNLGVEDGKDVRVGLNLTYRTLAAALKYDRPIPFNRKEREKPFKGYYTSETALVEQIKKNVVGTLPKGQTFRTVECDIMDIADDIAYSTYDLEDTFKAKFLTPLDLLTTPEPILLKVQEVLAERKVTVTPDEILQVVLDVFRFITPLADSEIERALAEKKKPGSLAITSLVYELSKAVNEDGLVRTEFTSSRIKRAMDAVQFTYNSDFPMLSRVTLEPSVLKEIEVMKSLTYVTMIQSPRLKVVEHRGKKIVTEIWKALHEGQGYKLLPTDCLAIYESLASDTDKARVIADFISGMTDRYAVEFYGRITATNPESIFKHL